MQRGFLRGGALMLLRASEFRVKSHQKNSAERTQEREREITAHTLANRAKNTEA
jgi:hypothetical protein